MWTNTVSVSSLIHSSAHKHLRWWVRRTLVRRLIDINTSAAESPLPGYKQGQSVLSYSTVQPAPYRVHKAWWMAYHHLPLWWLLNAVTPHQAHASEVRHIKTDTQATAGHNDPNTKRQCRQKDAKTRITEDDRVKEKGKKRTDKEIDEGACLMFAGINAQSVTRTEPFPVLSLLWRLCPTHVGAVFRACKI